MNTKSLFHKALTMCLMVAVFATCSMVALAGDARASGEIVVTGSSEASVTVNGEAVKSGRTIFSSSTIITSEGSGAIINLGKAGRIELAPNTTFAISFDNSAISGSLSAGSVTVLNAAQAVSVKTAAGETVNLNTGETAAASSGSASTKATSGTKHWWPFALIFGGAIAGLIWIASDNSNDRFGAGTVVISGTR
jgi:hypothetical protein